MFNNCGRTVLIKASFWSPTLILGDSGAGILDENVKELLASEYRLLWALRVAGLTFRYNLRPNLDSVSALPSFLLKLGPPLHHDMHRVKLALDTSALRHSVPDGQREEVDEDPPHLLPIAGGDDDHDERQAEDKCEEDEGDIGTGVVQHDALDDEIAEEDELHEIVDGAVNPSAVLREEDTERIGHDRLADRLQAEHVLALGEGLEHESR
ncbi:hypothetical protein K438DRAFT_1977989 [Mycena galopus ATCC 62051]|nr:hypothetical protein K438DRAFT_1977989 [Mycena galopus ATCC 62051]